MLKIKKVETMEVTNILQYAQETFADSLSAHKVEIVRPKFKDGSISNSSVFTLRTDLPFVENEKVFALSLAVQAYSIVTKDMNAGMYNMYIPKENQETVKPEEWLTNSEEYFQSSILSLIPTDKQEDFKSAVIRLVDLTDTANWFSAQLTEAIVNLEVVTSGKLTAETITNALANNLLTSSYVKARFGHYVAIDGLADFISHLDAWLTYEDQFSANQIGIKAYNDGCKQAYINARRSLENICGDYFSSPQIEGVVSETRYHANKSMTGTVFNVLKAIRQGKYNWERSGSVVLRQGDAVAVNSQLVLAIIQSILDRTTAPVEKPIKKQQDQPKIDTSK